jgi:hypothetical protein
MRMYQCRLPVTWMYQCRLPVTWNTREKADYSTFYVSAIISKGFPAIKSLGSFR